MLTTKTKRNAFRVLATLALAAAPAFASPIFVNNFSFETAPVGGGGFPNNCAGGQTCQFSLGVGIDGWTVTAGTGQMQLLPDTPPFSFVPDGTTFAFAGPGQTILQTVVPTVVADNVYTLQIDVGQRTGRAFDGTFELLIGGVDVANGAGSAPAQGGWSTWTATYTGVAADAGKSIAIELAPSGAQGYFDNVRLDAVPEPASFLLIGPALLFLGLRMRRTVRS